MDKKLIHLQIQHLIENINFRHDIISKYESTLSKIDIDGLKDKIRELYDHIIQLEMMLDGDVKVSQDAREKVKESVETPAKTEKAKSQPKPDVTAKKTETKAEKKEDKKAEKSDDKPSVKKEAVEIKKEVKETTAKKEAKTEIPKKTDTNVPVGEDPKFEKKTIVADKFLSEDDKTVAAKIKKNPINDLKKAIGLNDKFLFIRELFGNDLQAYTKAVDELNSLMVYEDVQEYIDRLSREQKWDDDSEHVLRFMEIVERKFL